MGLYIKSQEDPNYDDTRLTENEPVNQLVQQILMLLNTRKGDVLGDPDFGIDLERIIFETNASASTIERAVNTQIRKYCPLTTEFNVKVEVRFVSDVDKKIALLYVDIDKNRLIELVVS